jgi:hypothetical protein
MSAGQYQADYERAVRVVRRMTAWATVFNVCAVAAAIFNVWHGQYLVAACCAVGVVLVTLHYIVRAWRALDRLRLETVRGPIRDLVWDCVSGIALSIRTPDGDPFERPLSILVRVPASRRDEFARLVPAATALAWPYHLEIELDWRT